MKVLYLSTWLGDNGLSGVTQCYNQNYNALCKIYGINNVTRLRVSEYYNKSIHVKLYNEIKQLLYKKKILNKKEIIESVKAVDLIFIDKSTLGYLIKLIRKVNKKIPIIVFFHNCEYYYVSQLYSEKSFIKRWKAVRWIKYNESMALKYASCNICLNKRDYNDIANIYKIKPDAIIPIYIKDILSEKDFDSTTITNKTPLCTFLGSSFFANMHGIKWFLNNVYPYVNIRLRIIGKGMGILNNEIKDPNIQVLDSVKDIKSYMLESDFMLYPIFKGSGMKVKTCEALMYGKNIIGTKEAFEGYDLEFDKVGGCCNTAEEFISFINGINSCHIYKKYNSYSREKFLNNFSESATLPMYKNAISLAIDKTNNVY